MSGAAALVTEQKGLEVRGFSSEDSAVLYAARGLGIVLVVVGHVTAGPQNAFIYLFHMPLFFLLSGIAARQFGTADAPSTARRLKALAIPTLVAAGALLSVFAIDKTAYGLPALAGVFSAFWFIPALCMLLVGLCALGDTARRYWPIAASIVVGVLLACHIPLVERLPRTVLGAAFGLQFFLLGYLIPWKAYRQHSVWMLLSAAVLVLALPRTEISMDIATKNFGVPLVSVMYAASFSLACITLLFFFPSSVRTLAARIGQASLIVLLYHQAVHLIVRRLAPESPTLLVLAASIVIPVLIYHALRGRGMVAYWIGAR